MQESKKSKSSDAALADFKKSQEHYNRWSGLAFPSKTIITCTIVLMAVGLIMVTSSSVVKGSNLGYPLHYSIRQAVYMLLGLFVAYVTYNIPIDWWRENSIKILLLAIVCLVAVLLPGIGVQINGARRWINLGVINLQVSEFVRIAIMIFAAFYLEKQKNKIKKSWSPLLKLIFVLSIIMALLLLEPDFGSAAVIGMVILGMMFLAGVCLVRFSVGVTGVIAVAWVVLIAAPYRRQRLTSFTDIWEDPFGSGYQLVQSLIAIGRGEITGVGVGQSIQKHNYLPEAHTDFIFSIFAEETGFVGIVALVLVYFIFIYKAFAIANNADKVRMRFASCLAYGIGLWIGIQVLINMFVASGMLPTKGLTLPLISYGGSSVIACLILIAILLRIDSEVKYILNRTKSHQNG